MRIGFGLVAVVGLMVPGLGLGQDPLKTLPNNYKVALENEQVTVIRAHYGGREKIPVHDHTSLSTVFVYLSDSGPVRIDHAEVGVKAESVMRPPTTKGAYRVAPGIVERHSIENMGDLSSDFLRVEFKGVQLEMKEPFRGKAPGNLTASSDVVEFKQPGVEVERIVCVGKDACEAKASAAPSLLIAFTDATFAEDGERLRAGAVKWLPAGTGMKMEAAGSGTGSGPVHVLRILLPDTKSQTGAKAMTKVTGSFDVKTIPVTTDEAGGGPAVGRMVLDKAFHGPLEAVSKGQMLTAGDYTKGSAGYVAMEVVTGTLDGKTGSFALMHTGTMDKGTFGLTVTVVPGSGTGELVGLVGKMEIVIAGGKHSYVFEYGL